MYVQTPLVAEFLDKGLGLSADALPKDTVTLRVKSEDGKQTLLLKMRPTDTIAEVRALVDAYRTYGSQEKPYELRSAFPAKAYTDLQSTLQAAGLAPASTLFVRAIPAV